MNMRITPIKDLRNATGLSQKGFCEKYSIPLKSLQNWESNAEKGESRKCPPYVLILLKRVISQDFPDAVVVSPVDRLISDKRLVIDKRHEEALRYAIDKVSQSNISPYIDDVILYGSCARGTASNDSDVDILLVLKNSIKNKDDYEKYLRNLRSDVSTSNVNDPETDLHVSYGDEWRNSKKAYFQNIRRDGVSVWN